jgi:nickel-dependent lactate racemase
MAVIRIPYGREYLKLTVKKERLKAVLEPEKWSSGAAQSEQEIVRGALAAPIESKSLADIAAKAKHVLVITSDHTRPMPSAITLPLYLEEIRRNNPDVKIKTLVATGFHRLTRPEELSARFGAELCRKEEIIVHDSRDKKRLVFKGILPSGGELWVNDLVDWADLVVSEGFIEPHFFAGFSGGRKSVLPGIAGTETVLANHCARFIADEHARTGNLEHNPLHKDMLFAAQKVGLAFILNVALDANKKIINAFAGHPDAAHRQGCAWVSGRGTVKRRIGDIVITSNGGYPLDQNIYQSVKGMTSAEACVRAGGVIIMVAACEDGHGGEAFYRWFTEAKTPQEVTAKIAKIAQKDTLPDQWEAQILARVLTKCTVIMVTNRCDPDIVCGMHMLQAPDLETALTIAETRVGDKAEIVVIPDGVSVIVTD